MNNSFAHIGKDLSWVFLGNTIAIRSQCWMDHSKQPAVTSNESILASLRPHSASRQNNRNGESRDQLCHLELPRYVEAFC